MTKKELQSKFTKSERENKITDLTIDERWLNSQWADLAEENRRRINFLRIAYRGYLRMLDQQ